jgi:prephenate dehydrogenase
MRVAVVGLGKMGEPIARRVLGAGYSLPVWNRTPSRGRGLVEAGARLLAEPAEAWSHAGVSDDGPRRRGSPGRDRSRRDCSRTSAE